MERGYFEKLTCPMHPNDPVTRTAYRMNGNRVMDGLIQCSRCRQDYTVQNGIARFITPAAPYTDDWPAGSKPLPPENDPLKARLGSDLVAGILNIGCGTDPVTGVNLDRFEPNPVPNNFVLADGAALPFSDNAFAVSLSANILHYSLNPQALLREQIRVSRTSYIFVENSEWIGGLLMRIMGRGHFFHPQFYYRWTMESIKNLIHETLNDEGSIAVTGEYCDTSKTWTAKTLSALCPGPRALSRRTIEMIIKKEVT